MSKTLIYNIGTLQTPVGSYSHGGSSQGENEKLHDAAIVIEDGIISEIMEDGKWQGVASPEDFHVVLDALMDILIWSLEDTGSTNWP